MKKPVAPRRRPNLLPVSLQPAVIDHRHLLAAAAFALVGVPALAGASYWARAHYELQLDLAQRHRDELNQQIQNEVSARENDAESKVISAVEKALSEKLYWAEVFKELSNVAPKAVWLTAFEAAADEQGKKVVISGNAPSQAEIAEFFSRLERSYFFRHVRIKYTEAAQENDPSLFRFQFEGQLHDKKKPAGGPNG